jgi:AcrR family transcriptional regulator
VAATRVFRDKGYHAASVNDIIDAAQIARGTFYLYFTSKREIFAELTATFLGSFEAAYKRSPSILKLASRSHKCGPTFAGS